MGDNISKLGQLLLAYRQKKDIQARDLSKEIGISASTLCRIERGKNPDVDSYLKILNWMNK